MEPKIQKITHNESQSSSTAAQIVASFDDLLIEIFLRLPMKPLIRFKSVSKHWQSLISDSGFSIRRNPNPNPVTGLIFQVLPKFQIPEMDAPRQATYAHIVSFNNDDDTSPQIRTLKLIDTTTLMSSCNGLILCGSYNTHSARRRYSVCNPTTNKYSTLPQIPNEPDWMLPMCLAFDPSKSPHYKVVCTLRQAYNRNTLRYKFLVYSSETGRWQKSRVRPFRSASVDFQRGAYWNGAIHWVSFTGTEKPIYFDLDDDRMSREMMPTPHPILHPGLSSRGGTYYFGESCGHLHYIDDCATRMETDLVVYELRSDYSEWFVKYRIRHPSFSVGRVAYLCVVVRGKSDDDSFSIFLNEGKFVRYNFLNKTHEIICEVEGTLLEQCLSNVPLYLPLPHAESLCSV